MPDIHSVDQADAQTPPLAIRWPGGGPEQADDGPPPADLTEAEADRWLEDRDDQVLVDFDEHVWINTQPYH